MKTVVRKQSTDGVVVYKMTPTASHSLINSVILNFAPHLFIPRGKAFHTLQRVFMHLYCLISY